MLHPASEQWIRRAADLLDSYHRWLNRSLVLRTTPREDTERLDNAPFVVVAHGTETDPLLTFANKAALRLWDMMPEQFPGTPSRRTAEPEHRRERAALLKQTARDGFLSSCSGIRVTASGRRFRIHRATVWNVVDAEGRPAGQAAVFSDWDMLPEDDS